MDKLLILISARRRDHVVMHVVRSRSALSKRGLDKTIGLWMVCNCCRVGQSVRVRLEAVVTTVWSWGRLSRNSDCEGNGKTGFNR